MLLQKLVELADHLEEKEKLDPPLYSKKWIRYLIELDSQGHLLNPYPVDLSGPKGDQKRGQERSVPHVRREAGISPLLLADHAEYTLGLGRETSRPERVTQCHTAYLELLEKCANQSQDPVVSAVFTFLTNNPLEKLKVDEAFDRNGIIIFRVEDQFAHSRADVRSFWVSHHTPKPAESDDGEMQCIVCGQQKPVLERLKDKLKGIPGGQTSGTALISANKPAFESYGLKASQIAPTCMECGDRFTKALNYLLSDDNSHVWFSSLIFTFWTQEQTGLNWATWYKDPDSKAVRELINSVRSSKWSPTVDVTPFYAVSLSSSGGRAVVRDWIDTTIDQVKESLVDWFQGQDIVDTWAEESRPLSIYALAGATVRDLKDVPSPTYRALLRASLNQTPLPSNLLQQAINRNHAECTVTRPRAALIKLVLTTQNQIKENEMVELQIDHLEPAYHCGRLLAVLEDIQRSAQGKINTTIVDRFYGTASTAPASVYGRLVRGAQPHLSKLMRDRPSAGSALQQRLEDVMAALSTFPTTLDLKQQGFFSLGYYHQRAYHRAQARAHSEAKAKTDPAL